MLVSNLLFACAGAPVTLDKSSVDETVLDVRVTDDDIGPVGSNQMVLDGPDVEIPGASDIMYCVYGTYTGPTVGMHEVHTYQGEYGHHFTLNGTSAPALDVPDGTMVDCTSQNGVYQMSDLEPLGLPNLNTANGVDSSEKLPLPDGMAVKLETGQRYILQSHYLNTTANPIHIRDRVVITTYPEDQVENWAAALVFNRDDFRVPARGTFTTSFDCTIPSDVSLLYMLGHMHEWGTAFETDRIDSDVVTPYLSVPQWDPIMRDVPPFLAPTGDQANLPAGTTFRTTCSWSNTTDDDLVFPYEMCDTVGFVYPQEASLICDGNGQ